MERQQLIHLLSEGLQNVSADSGQALIRTLDRYDWSWQEDDEDEELIYEIRDSEGDTRYYRYDDSASQLWQRFPARMQLAFEELVSKRKRSKVGKARLLPFPDKRSPTPAA